MNILLIEPRTPETFWTLRHALRFVGKRATNPPLGLITLAGLLPREWSYRLIDLNCTSLADDDLVWADRVLVSAMQIHHASVAELARRCREAGKPLLGGGALFGLDPDNNAGVEHVVVGEAEELSDELIADLASGHLASVYEAPRFPDLAQTPLPRWDLLDMSRYSTMSVQSCRGCPFDCEFCEVVALNGRKPRYKTPDRFVAELEVLRRIGWQDSVFVVDDNFIGDRTRCLDLLHAIIDWRRRTRARMTFLTEASVNMATDPELLRRMIEAGFKKVFLGLETPSAASLRECHKLQNLRGDLVAAVRTIHSAGLEVMGGFIVGFDSDKPDIFQRQFEFIQKSGVVTAMVGLLQALPHSRLYRRLAREGRLLAVSDGDNTGAALNFKTCMDREFLLEGYRELMNRLYEPRTYYQRARTFFDSHSGRGPRGRLSWRDLRALVNSFWWIGLVHRGRWAFWRFLVDTLLRHPRKISLAINLAITGHHFRRVATTL